MDYEKKYKAPELKEFNKDTAHNGDIYLYQDGKLLYMGNTCPEPVRPSLWKRIKRWFK